MDKNHNLQNSEGGGGALFSREDNWRSDARLAARMLSLGVISEDRAKMLLVSAFELAEKAASGDKPSARNYAAAMKIPLTLLRIEQAELERLTPKQHEHSGTITVDERRTQLLGIVAILRDRAGAIADSGASNGNGKHYGNGHANGNGMAGPSGGEP